MLKLVRPTAELKEAALEYKYEHFEYGDKEINGSELLDQMDSYEDWLVSVSNNTSPETVNPTWVVTDTFFAVNEEGRIVGIIDLRHTLNDFLKDFGNSGYSVRPTERRKGYATEMLRQVKEVAKQAGMTELHMATFKDNIASVKTIVNNGGVSEREFVAEGKPAEMYVIEL
ncbi:MAG: GNAT family N-acetyltransferase [Lachnospiraceae bacterium]|nr:GNAT family N-acetyltransferase [Lachnospiraceae bacterium]